MPFERKFSLSSDEPVRPSVVDSPKEKEEKPKIGRPKGSTDKKPRATRTTRKVRPPVKVEPGWVHKAIATKILQSIQTRITVETGEPFNVGDLPTTETLATEGNIIDDRQPVDLLSRILAHLMHRIPGIKKFEKGLEGKDSNSGPMNDIVAFFAQLYSRNEVIFDAVRHQMMEQAMAKKNAPKNGGVNHDVSV